MLDLDHFKAVNDTYGHITGDKVLRSLARVLGQRLRRTDLIGRAGGEEFAVVLIDSGGDTSLIVMEQLRKKFEELKHRAEGKEFSCTFSCGLAAMPPHEGTAVLRDAADKALYQAKNRGRNRIVLAGG